MVEIRACIVHSDQIGALLDPDPIEGIVKVTGPLLRQGISWAQGMGKGSSLLVFLCFFCQCYGSIRTEAMLGGFEISLPALYDHQLYVIMAVRKVGEDINNMPWSRTL